MDPSAIFLPGRGWGTPPLRKDLVPFAHRSVQGFLSLNPEPLGEAPGAYRCMFDCFGLPPSIGKNQWGWGDGTGRAVESWLYAREMTGDLETGRQVEEGQRKLVEHVRFERSARTRKDFLEERRRQGRVTCDACAEDLAHKYDSAFSEVVEVHHRVPLWKGVQKATGDMLALLCPTCHRVVHFRQREPREVEEVARLVRRQR